MGGWSWESSGQASKKAAEATAPREGKPCVARSKLLCEHIFTGALPMFKVCRGQVSRRDTQVQPTRSTSLQSGLRKLRIWKLREICVSQGLRKKWGHN